MLEVFDWHNTADAREVVQRAVRALSEGQLVGLPLGTGYGVAVSALDAEAVAGLESGLSLTLAVRDAADALDWVPALSSVGRRLARRCWPGPVKLVCGDGVAEGLVRRLPASVRARLCTHGTLSLATPAHEAILEVLSLVPGPVVFAEADNGSAASAEQFVQVYGERLALVIDDGPGSGQSPTVVRLDGASWNIMHAGAVARETLERLAGCLILFVCTGNTCRSPLAEALCKKLLAEQLGCAPAELPGRGFVVQSAGLAAMMGSCAADDAVATARELGADLAGHCSQPLTPRLASQADHLLAMTRGHLYALADRCPRPTVRPRLLSPEGEDVPDPIGAGQEVYRECALLILRHLTKLLPEVLEQNR